jgi:ABC-type Fe3+ transport system substrate-binding protein
MILFFSHAFRRFLLTTICLVVGCGVTRAVQDAEVIVISPHWEGIKDETSRAFRAWHEKKYGQPAIIRWRDAGGSSQIVKFLRNEYLTSSSSGIDVLYGGGVDPFRELKKDGLLARCDLPQDVLAALPAQLNGMDIRDPDQEWFGASLSGFGIITNERARAVLGLPTVRHWEDLTDPSLAGWISSSDPRASGSALAIYEIILQSLGWDRGWAVLMQMSGNTRNYLSSSAASAVEVGLGDAVYGVSIDIYGQAQSAYYGPGNVSFVLPEGQTVITPDSIAVLKNPPHPEIARHFLEFVLSREGQLLWMLPKGAPGGATRAVINRMSVLPSLYAELVGVTPVRTNPFLTHSDFIYSEQLGSKRRAILSLLLAACMIDPHDELTRAWKALQSPAAQKLSPQKQQAVRDEFLKPPCTEAELLSWVDTDWKDPVKRAALVNRWQNDALRRYASLRTEINEETSP